MDTTTDELRNALEASVKLQSHYAGLLNMYDGGSRLEFPDADRWILRLRDLAAGRTATPDPDPSPVASPPDEA